MIKFYRLIDSYPFTVLTPQDSVMLKTEPGDRVKIDHEKGNVYWFADHEQRWYETIDCVSNTLLERLEEI